MIDSLHIELSTPACHESTTFRLTDVPQVHAQFPVEPGAVRVDPDGCTHLYFAPGHWLTTRPPHALAPSGLPGTLSVVDVSGKWRLLQLFGVDAELVLRCQIAVDSILAGRACAAVTVFDCPVVVVRRGGGFDLLAHASYSEHLRIALVTAHQNLQRSAQAAMQ